jgi:hypothetical protein
MGLDGDDPCVGPIVMGHDGEAAHVRADIEDGSDVVGTQVVDAVLIMEYRIGELDAVWLDVEILAIDLVANGMGHGEILSEIRQKRGQ